MATLVWMVACLVISSSDKRSLRAVEVRFASFATQPSNQPNSPMLFAAKIHGRRTVVAVPLSLDQWTISELQSVSNCLRSLFWIANLCVLFFICQCIKICSIGGKQTQLAKGAWTSTQTRGRPAHLCLHVLKTHLLGVHGAYNHHLASAWLGLNFCTSFCLCGVGLLGSG